MAWHLYLFFPLLKPTLDGRSSTKQFPVFPRLVKSVPVVHAGAQELEESLAYRAVGSRVRVASPRRESIPHRLVSRSPPVRPGNASKINFDGKKEEKSAGLVRADVYCRGASTSFYARNRGCERSTPYSSRPFLEQRFAFSAWPSIDKAGQDFDLTSIARASALPIPSESALLSYVPSFLRFCKPA